MSIIFLMLFYRSYFRKSFFKSSKKSKNLVVHKPIVGMSIQSIKYLMQMKGINLYSDLSELPKWRIIFFQKYILKNFVVERFVRHLMFNNILQQVKHKVCKSFRHMAKLPVKGQRTKTNALTSQRLGWLQKAIQFNLKNKDLF